MSLKTRRRGTELEDAILEAAWEILVERGYHGFTYEAIAAAAGTSRPVLYRRFPQREDLMLATVRKHWWSQPIPVPDTGRLRDDAIGYLTNAVDGRWRVMTFIGVQLMEYFRESGSSFADLRDRLRPPGQVSGLDTILARAVERGELAPAARPPRVVNLPFDLLRHDLFMTMRRVPPEAIAEMIDTIWLPLLRAPATPDGPHRV